ncbi:MAG: PaaI family thioesterase [Solirubrobacteraceae bacterium]
MERAESERFRELLPFCGLLDIELLKFTAELVQARMAWAPERCTAGGVLHGGALMSLADSCGGGCAFLNLPDGTSGTSTIESKTNFFSAVRSGQVTASAHPLHAGRSVIVIETNLTLEDGSLVAKTIQSQAVLHNRD